MAVRLPQSNAAWVNILICVALCNARPVAKIDAQTGVTSITSTASTVSYPPSATSQSKEQSIWDVVILYGYIGFILFAGFLTWLGGKVYVAIFGMPELNIEPVQSYIGSGNIASQNSTESEDMTHDDDTPIVNPLYNGDELRQLIQNTRTRRRAILQSSLIPPTVANLYYLEQLPFHGVDDLAEALGHKSTPKQLPRRVEARNLFAPQSRADVIARHNARARGHNLIRTVLCSTPSYRQGLQDMMDFYSLGQMPFYWVEDLALELNSEADVIRRFFSSLLPFYGVVNWEEAHMASWEFARLLLLELPFCDVSDEMLGECACYPASGASGETRGRRRCVKVFNDVEAAVPSSKEPSCPKEAVDFVHYEDEILKKATESFEITC